MIKNTKDNIYSINKTVKLNNKQLRRLDNTPSKSRQSYLLSLFGLKSMVPKVNYFDQSRLIYVPGKVLTAFNQLLPYNDRMFKPLTSTSKSRWIGVEIECILPDGGDCIECDGTGEVYMEDHDDTEECEECGGSGNSNSISYRQIIRDLRELKITRCAVVHDGSLNRGGVEFVLLFDSARGFEPLEKLTTYLSKIGATIDSSCGLHVHLDTRKAIASEKNIVDRLSNKWGNYLDLLKSLVPTSRTNNQYCKPVVSYSDRYSAVNLDSLSKHGTVEVRLHSGSTNFTKIKNWITLLSAIHSKPLNYEPKDATDLSDLVSSELVEYFEERRAKFNDTADTAEPDTDIRVQVASNGYIEVIVTDEPESIPLTEAQMRGLSNITIADDDAA